MKTILVSFLLIGSMHLQAQTETTDEQYEMLKGAWKISYATNADGELMQLDQPDGEVPAAFQEIKFMARDKAQLISPTWSVKAQWHIDRKKIYFDSKIDSKNKDVFRSYKVLTMSEEALQLQYTVRKGEEDLNFTVYYKKQ